VEDLTGDMDSAFPVEDGGGKRPATKEKAASGEQGTTSTAALFEMSAQKKVSCC